jgi:hypothetical protein
MNGGGYNRILGLTITAPKTKKYTLPWLKLFVKPLLRTRIFSTLVSTKPSKYILRAPRNAEREVLDMEYDVATLTYAYRALRLPFHRL